MTDLLVGFGLFYLTEVEAAPWRSPMDYNARIIVKGLKKEQFKGYADFKVKGQECRFDTDNIEELIPLVMGRFAALCKAHKFLPRLFSIVPIPNSGMAIGKSGPFRTTDLAEMFSKRFGSGAEVEPVLVWDKVRPKQHESSGFRHPDQFESHFRLISKPKHPIVIFDDVLTSGSQMIAAARFLSSKGYEVRSGIVAARATKIQHTPMLAWSTEAFPLDREGDEFDVSDYL